MRTSGRSRNIADASDIDSMRLFHGAVEASHDSVIITGADFDAPGPEILYVNPAFERLTGWPAAEAIGRSPRILQGRKTDRSTLNSLRAALHAGKPFRAEIVNYRRDGTPYNAEWTVAPIRDATGTVTHYVSLQRDITHQARQQTERELLVGALEEIADEVIITDTDGRMTYVNRAFRQRTGRQQADVVGRLAAPFDPERVPAIRRQDLRAAVAAGNTASQTFREVCRHGSVVFLEQVISPIRASDGSIRQYVITGRDVSGRVNAETELKRLATTDRLTGLYNRLRFEELLEYELKRAARSEHPFCVVMLDIDSFKAINDRFGHQAGDDVLVRLGQLLLGNSRGTDHTGRWGGEEFMLLLPDTTAGVGVWHAERLRVLLESAEMPRIGRITSSFGVAESRREDSVKTLLRRADEALYRAKSLGKNRVETAAPDDDASV